MPNIKNNIISIQVYLYITLIVLCCISCSKERNYEVKFINNTNFTIDNLELSRGIYEDEIAITPNGTSKSYNFKYNDPRFAPNPFYLISSIKVFSNSVKIYEIENEHSNDMSEFEENQVNYIYINYNSSFTDSSDMFIVTIND